MAEELGPTRESLAWNPGRETVHADRKTGEPEVFLEPLLWGLFSLGGFITAFLFPITVFLLFLAPPFGVWPTDPAQYTTFVAHWQEEHARVVQEIDEISMEQIEIEDGLKREVAALKARLGEGDGAAEPADG